MMKNNFAKILIFSIVFSCIAIPLFAIPEHPVNLQMSLGTAMKFYGDENVRQYRAETFGPGSTRFILNSEIGGGFFLDEYISLNLGGIVSFDWFEHDYYLQDGSGKVIKDSMFLLNYDIYFGVRVFPFLLGFSFGVDYITGGCMNYLKIAGVKAREDEGWANGFRFVFEYNILNNRIGWSPAAGIYWQNMSRNGGHDNTVAVYVKAALR